MSQSFITHAHSHTHNRWRLFAKTAMASGVLALLYFFYLPFIVFLMAPRTHLGDVNLIFFPPHVDPHYRLSGVCVSAGVIAAAVIGSFFLRDAQRSTWRSLVISLLSLVGVGSIVILVSVQTFVALLPDHLEEAFLMLQPKMAQEGFGVGWPAQEEPNYAKARGAIEVVMADKKKERDHKYVEQVTNQCFRDWQQACSRAAYVEGATITASGVLPPHHWTKQPIINPHDSRVYFEGQDTGWLIEKTEQGTITLFGSPP